jgi:hypothetical protein
MLRRPLPIPTLCLLLLSACAAVRFAAAAGLPIQLEDVKHVPFTGAALVVTDLDGASGPDLAGVSGSDVVVAFNDGHGSFAAQIPFAMGNSELSALGVDDLDGDGRPDLVALSPGLHTLVVRLNAPGLAFGLPESTQLPGGPYDLALGDLNGDGHPDAVTAINDSASLAILLNDGTGHFRSVVTIPSGKTYGSLVIGDFTGDGVADLVVPAINPVHALILLAGHGDGSFELPRVAVVTLGIYRSAVAADFDGDGDLDLAAAGDAAVAVFENLGHGEFAPPQRLDAGMQGLIGPRSGRISVVDADRDGRLDIAFPNDPRPNAEDFGSTYFAVSLNRGGLSFERCENYRVGPGPTDVALADLDGDGWPDGVATCCGLDLFCSGSYPDITRYAFLLHNRGGAFEALLEVYDPTWLPARDGRDAHPDLYGSLAGVMYRSRNRGNGTFEAAERIGWGDPREATDLDADGDDDLLVASGDSLWVLPNLGGGDFGPPSFTLVGSTFRDFADFDGYGTPDLFVTDGTGETMVYPGDGHAGFEPPIDYGRSLPPLGPDNVRAADIDHDGAADVLYLIAIGEHVGGILRNANTSTLVVFRNDRSDGFAAPETSVVVTGSQSPLSGGAGMLRIGDWNGDGRADAAFLANTCASETGAIFSVFFGNGDGSFGGLETPPFAGSSPCDLRVADLNADGLDDMVYINSTAGFTYAANPLASDGLGGFAAGWYQMGDSPMGLRLADLDGDGRLDVVTRNWKMPLRNQKQSYSIRRNVTPASLPTAALVSLVASKVEGGIVHLDWFAAGESVFSATIERRSLDFGWSAIARRTSDGTGHLRYEDHEVEAGGRYAYRVRTSDAAGERVSAEAWVMVPRAMFALHGAWPNPSGARPSIAFTLPASGAVDLQVLDVSGRRVRFERREGLAAGPQRIVLEGSGLAPGVYLARLSFAGRQAQTRFVVLP